MSLARIQLMSIVTKAVTTALGIVQSVIVIRLLGPAGWGLVGLVMSIGGLVGVTQHLGVVDGAIREIAVLKNRREIGKVFWVSHLVRQIVTLPLTVALIMGAGIIANKIYHRPEITLYIQVFAASLILQGFQDVLGATLTGIKKFTALYAVQIVTAAINIAVFGYLTWQFKISGFFWAVIITTAIMVFLYGIIVLAYLRSDLRLPNWFDIKRYTKRVMRVGAYMYLSRIFFVIWQRLPLLLMGGILAADELGYFNTALTFGSKLTIVAMALSEVNLSWMSSLYESRREEFRRVVTRNMQRVLLLMMGMALTLVYFAPEIVRYVIGPEFLPAEPMILIITAAFFLYALTDIGTSSVFVAADRPRIRAAIYGIMTLVTAGLVGWALTVQPDVLVASIAVLTGSALAYGIMIVVARRRLGISLLPQHLFVFLILFAFSVGWLFMNPGLVWRVLVFLLLTTYVCFEARRNKLLPTLKGHSLVKKKRKLICFSGAFYDAFTWTNRQHVMSRMADEYDVLYIEPRVWFVSYVINNWREPQRVVRWLVRIFWYEKKEASGGQLFIKAQWNLVPGSREFSTISFLNFLLNRWNVLWTARLLGFRSRGVQDEDLVLWLYDTEAAEYLKSLKRAKVVYDCVDDHAAQAGVDRNSERVRQEEESIAARADLVTVTSEYLYRKWSARHTNVQLVLNAGDVELFSRPAKASLANERRPIIGSVGTLDAYKYDFDLLYEVAKRQQEWQFVLLGAPVVDNGKVVGEGRTLNDLQSLPNVEIIGTVSRVDVPGYVQKFDVCMIPYRSNDYNRASFPLKFWEFMATGKPIVVCGLPELKTYNYIINYIPSEPGKVIVDEFISSIKAALLEPKDSGQQRKLLAQEHSWEKRVTTLKELLNNILTGDQDLIV